jgi:hypothetical protein
MTEAAQLRQQLLAADGSDMAVAGETIVERPPDRPVERRH